MPIYDFKCDSCGITLELWCKYSEIGETRECTNCEQGNLHHSITKVGDFRWGKNCSMAGIYDTKSRRTFDKKVEKDHDTWPKD